jgi:coproporphyrinogen III oxidase-like Fe-S oxidoreductase
MSPRASRRRSSATENERAIYARVVAELGYPEPSTLVHRLNETRSRRVAPSELLPHWRNAAAKASDEAAWNMYVHVPYCKSICSFCNYKRLIVSSREALDEYVAFIESEAKLFGEALSDVRFGALYVGGGTPSVLAAEQLRRVFTAIHDNFEFEQGAQKNFEYDPMVMTPDRFGVAKEFGFTRFSFGIQSVDVDVNALHGRGRQQRSHIEKQFRMLGEHGAENANVDFLLGLDGTTAEQMLREIEEVLSTHRPDEVTVYFLHPTPEYVAARFGGDFERFRAHLDPFERMVPEALPALAERLGYRIHGDGKHVINMSNTRRDKPRSARPEGRHHHYCDVPSQVHRPLYLLGLGDSARSRIFGEVSYRAEHDADDRDPSSPRYVAFDNPIDDEIFGYLAFVFRDGDTLWRSRFRRTFGRDVLEVCERPARKLAALGVLDADDEQVRLTPQSRQDRLRDLMFFLPAARRQALAEATARPR